MRRPSIFFLRSGQLKSGSAEKSQWTLRMKSGCSLKSRQRILRKTAFFSLRMNSSIRYKNSGDGNANTSPTFNASKILKTILVDQGLFVEQVSGSYSFSHLTFQEYLTASYVVRNTESMREVGEGAFTRRTVARSLLIDCWADVRSRRFACGDGGGSRQIDQY